MRKDLVLSIAAFCILMLCQQPATANSGTTEGWSYEGHADGIPNSLAGPFISTYDGVVFAELGPNGEAVWRKSTQGGGWLRRNLQIPQLPSDGGKVYLTFWYDLVAIMEDGVPPGGMEVFLAGTSKLKLTPTTGQVDRMVKWDVSQYAGTTVPLEVKYWFTIISHGFGPTTGFWGEFIGVSLNMVETKSQERNTARQIAGEAELVMRNDQRDFKKGETFNIDVFGEISGTVWFVPRRQLDPPLRIPHQPSGAYTARITLIPNQLYDVTEIYEIGLTALGMVGKIHPVEARYTYRSPVKKHRFNVTWNLSNLSVEVSGDVEGSAESLTANWLSVPVKATRDIKLGETIRGKVQYSATYIKRSSIKPTTPSLFLPPELPDFLRDTDGDGLTDRDEIRIHNTDPNRPDSDEDGLTDGQEVANRTAPLNPDTDGDGLNDGEEVNTHSTNPNLADTDNDDLSDSEELNTHSTDPTDSDSDDDGLEDGEEVNAHNTDANNADSDSDGLSDGAEVNTHNTNPLQSDTDGDGFDDAFEVNVGLDPLVPDDPDADPDDDGLSNRQETEYNTNPLVPDTDGDTLTDGEEINLGINPNKRDSDDDGLDDQEEIKNHGTNPSVADSDGDGLDDGEEVKTHKTDPVNSDSDTDGLSDGAEVNTHNTEPLKSDTDDDGLNDGFEVNAGLDPLVSDDPDADPDEDGLSNLQEAQYNINPFNSDTDGDGLNDGEEVNTHDTNPNNADTDRDGLSDAIEVNTHGTNPRLSDTDSDQLDDAFELNWGLDPLAPNDANADPDRDGLSNLQEASHNTNPLNSDTDGDGLTDGEEVARGTDPNNTDSDSDGLSDQEEIQTHGTNPLSADSDSDGITDSAELNTHNTDPNKADSDDDRLSDSEEINIHSTNPLSVDSDGDGLTDGKEIAQGTDPNNTDTDSDGLSDADEINIHRTSPLQADSDNDGLADGAEISESTDPKAVDTDNDGLSDGKEVNTHGTSPLQADTDSDGLSDQEEISIYGSSPIRVDTDSDGLTDSTEISNGTDPNDADSDNDGLSDGAEVNTHNTNPLASDSDEDGLNDGDEITHSAEPNDADTDNDGLTDGAEVNTHNTDPNDRDTDNDSMPDDWEVQYSLNATDSSNASEDPDNDGFTNLQEYQRGTSPIVGSLISISAKTYSFSKTIYTAPVNACVKVTAKAVWTDWHPPLPHEKSTSQLYLIEAPYRGGSGCDWVEDYEENNWDKFTTDRLNSASTNTGSILVGSGKSVAFVSQGCGLGDNFTGVRGVSWTVDEAKFPQGPLYVCKGETIPLIAELNRSAAGAALSAISLDTDNNSIATVSGSLPNFTIHGHAAGTVTITATIDETTCAVKTVTVVDAEIDSDDIFCVNQTDGKATISVTPSGAPITLESSNPEQIDFATRTVSSTTTVDFTIGSTPSYLFDDITLRAKLPNGQVCFEKTVTVVRTDFAGTLYARVDQDPAIFCPPDVTNTPLVGPESRIDKLLDLYNGANNALKTVEPEDEDAAEIVADTKWVKKPAGGGAFQMCLEVTPGSKPGKVRLEVRDGNDRLIHKGDIVVVKVDLNIARLNGETVSQGIEHSEGSIAKVYVPGLDSTPNGSQVKIPTMRVDPPLTASGLTFTLKKVGPSSNVAGKVEVWRGNTIFLHDNEPETDVDRSLLTLPPSTPAWRVRCTATGVVDLALIVKKGGVELCRDQVRIICTPVPPKNGKILLVNDNNELDLPELGFEAFDTIASALWAAPSNANANIAIARGTYNEHHLIVPQTVIIVGLGGGFETTGPDERIEFNFANLPIVNGNVGGIRDVVFIMNGGLQRMVAALKITKGKSQAGGGVQILFSSQDEVRFCEITDNIAGPNGYGGGIYVANSDRVFITKNRIKGNEAQIGGGGVFITDSISTISHNRISVNDAGVAVPVGVLPTQSGYGGGIGIQGSNGNVNMVKNIINLNYASTVGGGIGIVGLHDNLESLIGVGVIGGIPTTIEDNVIAFNEALAYGRGATQSTTKERGGGIYNGSNSSVLTLEGNTIIWNTSGGDGGGITTFVEATTNGKNNDIKHNTAYDDGGGIDHGTQSEGYWEDNRIAHNKAVNEHGGGLHASVRSSVVIKRNSFHENRANLQGGGLYLRNSYLTSQGGNTIEANVASEHGGGIFILAETDAPHLLTLGNPTLTLTANDKVLSNTAVGHGGGVSVEDTSNLVDSTINIQHTLFDGNRANGTVAGFRTAGLYLSNNDDFTVNNNRFQNHNGAAFTGVDLESNPLTTGRVEIISNSFNRNRCGMNLKSSPVIVKANLFRGNTFCHINLTDVKFLWVFSNRFTRNPITKFGIIVDKSNYESGELEIHRNSFIGHNLANASHAIFVVVTPAGSFIDAKNNWWNSVGGPHDPPPPVGFDGNYNNNPPGDRVTDGVDYKPFLNSSP